MSQFQTFTEMNKTWFLFSIKMRILHWKWIHFIFVCNLTVYNFICPNTSDVLSLILMTICSGKKCDAKFAFSSNLTQIFKRTAPDSNRGTVRHRVILFLLQNWPRYPKQIFNLNCIYLAGNIFTKNQRMLRHYWRISW